MAGPFLSQYFTVYPVAFSAFLWHNKKIVPVIVSDTGRNCLWEKLQPDYL